MNKEASKLYDEFFDKWIHRFIPDKGDNRLECEYALHKLIKALQEDWISVEDELPKEAKAQEKPSKLGWLIYDGIRVSVTFLHPANWNDKDDLGSVITHWQPLPKPPITKNP